MNSFTPMVISIRSTRALKYQNWNFNPYFFVLFASLWTGIIFSALSTTPQHFPDTPGYFSETGELNGYFSVFGNSIRGWPTVILFTFLNSDFQRILFQSLIYAVSWSFLICAVFKSNSHKSKMINYFISWAFVFIALTPRFIQWNQFLLSESLSVSLVIFAVGAIYLSFNKAYEKMSFKWFMFSSLLFSFAAINRASLLPLTLIPILLLPYLFKIKNKSKSIRLFLIFVPVISVIYPIQYNNATNKYWGGDGTNLTRSSFYFIYNTSDGNLQPVWGDALWLEITSKSPGCLSQFRGSGINSGRNPYYQAAVMVTLCPEGIAWLNENYDKEYLKFILNNPVAAFKYEASMLKYVMDSTPYPVETILPVGLSRIFESFNYQGLSYRPHLLWFSSALLAMLMLMLLRIKPNYSTILAMLVFGLGLSSITLTQFFIVSEPVRITTPATLIILVGAILVILEVWQLLLNRVSTNRSRIPEVINNNQPSN